MASATLLAGVCGPLLQLVHRISGREFAEGGAGVVVVFFSQRVLDVGASERGRSARGRFKRGGRLVMFRERGGGSIRGGGGGNKGLVDI